MSRDLGRGRHFDDYLMTAVSSYQNRKKDVRVTWFALGQERRQYVLLYIAAGLVLIWIIAAIAGVGKNTVFRNPGSLSDAQIERTIRLTQVILDTSSIGSKAWNEAGAKYSAAFQEQCKRRGIPYKAFSMSPETPAEVQTESDVSDTGKGH